MGGRPGRAGPRRPPATEHRQVALPARPVLVEHAREGQDPDRHHEERQLDREQRQLEHVARHAAEVRHLPQPDAEQHPDVAERELAAGRHARRPVAADRVRRRDGEHRVQRERGDDVGREGDERDRPPPQPAEAQQRLALARAAPAELLAPELGPVVGRVRVDHGGRLVDGPPAIPQQLVGEHAIVADVLRHAEHRLGDQALDGRLERLAPVRDRASRQAADLAEHRLRGHGRVVAQVLEPVREPPHGVRARVEHRLSRRDAADARGRRTAAAARAASPASRSCRSRRRAPRPSPGR